MIESVNIENFRCFRKLMVNGLRRINIIVGANASGKTVFLEAIFLASAASPEIALRLRSWRGLGEQIQLSRNRRDYESLWEDLFFRLDQKKTIRIALKGSPERNRSLLIHYETEGTVALPLGEQRIDATTIVPIVFEWTRNSQAAFTSKPEVTEKGFVVPGGDISFPSMFYSTVVKAATPKETATRYSDLSKQGREHLIVEALRRDYPYIENLSVEIGAGIPMVHAKVRSIDAKIPVALVSQGLGQLLNYLLAIATSPHGVVLIDEIESGFYFDKLSDLWATLFHFSCSYNTQVFATTHSRECLRALHSVIRDNEREFCLLRAQREDGECTLRRIEGPDLRSAIEHEVEIR